MMEKTLETIQKDVLQLLQEGIPLTKRPFLELSKILSTSESELMKIILELKEKKLIRQISPIYDTKMLGYESALVAFKVSKQEIETVANYVSSHPGVSHNYERNHHFNLWFTLAVPPDSALGLEETVGKIFEHTKALDYAVLYSKKVFKIRVKLNVKANTTSKKEKVSTKNFVYKPLTKMEKEIVKVTQADLSICERPFLGYAEKLKISEEILFEKIQSFMDKGVIRRFVAILNHRKAGFSANGMSVWKIPKERMDEVGKKLASYQGVSHCYERSLHPSWDYNLFAMTHGKTKEEVEETVQKMGEEIQISDYMILYSTREFKKKRLQYFIEDFYEWEKTC